MAEGNWHMVNLSEIINKAAFYRIIVLVAVCGFSVHASGKTLSTAVLDARPWASEMVSPLLLAYENDESGEVPNDNRFRKNYKQWKDLPPAEKKQLRNRMNQYKQMPREDKEQYQQKLEKWKKLPPEDRRRIQKSLKDWKDLSPEEKEAIRRRLGKE